MLVRQRVQGTLSAGDARVHFDVPTVGELLPYATVGYHPDTQEEFDALIEALGGLDAAQPIGVGEKYSVDFVGEAPEHLRDYSGGRIRVQVFKPRQVTPASPPVGDPFFMALRERQQAAA